MHDTVTDWEQVSLVPPRRLGGLLSTARSAKGLTLEDVSHQCPTQFTMASLASIERGTRDVTDREVRVLADIYELEASTVVPARSKLVVDLDEGLLQVEDTTTRVARHEVSRHDVLTRYLAMVYSMRNVEVGREITLRVDDLEVLGRALRVGSQTLEADLVSLMSNPNDVVGWRTRLLRGKVMVPAAGLLVAFCGTGAVIMVQPPAAPVTEPVPIAATIPTEIGDAVVLERDADGNPGEIRVRTGDEPSTPTNPGPSGGSVVGEPDGGR